MANANLTSARNAKQDEFYTQYNDIQKEINAYIDFDKDVFRDKTILYSSLKKIEHFELAKAPPLLYIS